MHRFVFFSCLPVFLILCCLTNAASAQTAALRGRVTDEQGAAIGNASITALPRGAQTQVNTTSNTDGNYQIKNLKLGAYLLTIEAPGFARQVHQLQLTANEQTFHLQLTVANLSDSVFVTAAGLPQRSTEISKAVSQIGLQEIEARNELSLAETLRLTPGLRVQQLGGPGSFTAIKTRGLRNEDTAILLDGFRFRDSSSIAGDALSFISDLLLINTQQVEVLRGSGSSLYGTNAIGGVINVLSETSTAAHGSVQAEGGQLGLFRLRTTHNGGWRAGRLLYNVGFTQFNLTRGLDAHDTTRNTSGQAFLKYALTPATALSGRLFVSKIAARLNDSPYNAPASSLPASGIVPARALALDQQRLLETGRPFNLGDATFIPALNDPDNRRAAQLFAGSIRLDQALSTRLSYQLSYQTLRTERTFFDGPQGVRFEPQFNNANTYDARIDTAQARLDYLAGPAQSLTGGYEFERESFDNVSTDQNSDPAKRLFARTQIAQRSHTFFVQDQLHLLKQRLQISLAMRAQWFQLTRPQFFGGAPQYTNSSFPAPPVAYTGDGSIAYFIQRSNTKLRAHVGNGYRAPSLYERFGTGFFGGSFSAYGDPRLRPDRSIAFDAGLDQTFASDRLKLVATYFYTRLQEINTFDFSGAINPTTDPYKRFGGYRNIGGGLARGAELSFAAKASRSTDVQVSYTYTNADQRQPTSVTGFLPSFGISSQMVTAYVNQRLGQRLNLTFDLFAASEYFVALGFPSRAYRFDAPVKGDLGASYVLPLRNEKGALRFFGKVENVFNRQYFENGYRTPGATFLGGMAFQY